MSDVRQFVILTQARGASLKNLEMWNAIRIRADCDHI